MAVKLIAATLALLLLCGCAEALGAVKEAAGLSKAPPAPEPPPSSQAELPRRAPDPWEGWPDSYGQPEHDWPESYEGFPPGYPPDSGLPGDYGLPEGYGWPEDDGNLPSPDAGDSPGMGDGLSTYYNGYLGLTVNIPEECYTDEDWYMERRAPAALTGSPEDSMSRELFDWEDNEEEGGYFLSLMDIDYYTADAGYGFYSLMLDYFPEMTEEEYFAFTEAFLEEDDGSTIYTVTGSDLVTLNGAEARHYTIALHDLEDAELAYTLEYFITPVRGIYVLQVLTYPPDSIEAMAISQRLAQEVCEFSELVNH
jgi:hypothetical protein